MEELYRIAGSAVLYLSGDIFHRLIGFFYRIAISRLGQEQYGLFNLGMATYLTVSVIAASGIDIGLIHFISYYRSKNEPQKVKDTVHAAVKISALSGLAFASLLFFSADIISLKIFHNKELAGILKLFSLGIPFSVISTIFLSIPVALQEIRYIVYIKQFLESLIKIALAIILVILGMGLFWVVSSFLLAQVICFFLSFYVLQKVHPVEIRRVLSAGINWELVRYSLPASWSVLSWIFFIWTDSLMLGFLVSPAATGLYNAATPFVWMLLLIPLALNSILLPVITGLHAQDKDIKNIFSAVERWALTINLPLCILLFAFSGEIIYIFFGKSYIAAQNALKILSVGYFVSSLNFSKNNLLLMLKKTTLVLALKIATIAVNIVFNLRLIPMLGMEGAALATCLSLILQSIILELFASKATGIHLLTGDYLRPVIPAAISLGLIRIINAIPVVKTWNEFSRVSAGSLIFLLSYAAGLIIFKGIKKADVRLVKSLLSRASKAPIAKTGAIPFQ